MVGADLLPGGTYRDVYVNSVTPAVGWWVVQPSPELVARWRDQGPYTEPFDSILPYLAEQVVQADLWTFLGKTNSLVLARLVLPVLSLLQEWS